MKNIKNIKNKFILLIISLVVVVIGVQLFISSIYNSVDTNSYATLIEGQATLNKITMDISDKSILSEDDEIRTIGESSIVVIEWGDGSITRLGGNTYIKVQDVFVNEDLSKINLSFNLFNGKTWSNVVSFLGEDSYFNEYFNDIEAGVRGTVFDVDLDNDYVYVSHNEVTLTNSDGKKYSVKQDNPFSIKTFDIIAMKEFLSELRDLAWADLNNSKDSKYVDVLRSRAEKIMEVSYVKLFLLEFFSSKLALLGEVERLGDIEKIKELATKLDEEDKKDVYAKLQVKYQALNYATNKDIEFYKAKIFYKRVLLIIANAEQKESLLRSSLNDFKDVVNSNDYSSLSEIIPMLSENKGTLDKIGVEFNDMFKGDFIPEDLKEIFKKNLEPLKNIFPDNLSDIDFSVEDLKNLDEKTKDIIHNSLDKLLEKVNK